MVINLIFSNKPSEINKKLIKFFQINLLNLNKASITFKFEVAHPDEIDSYVKRGIKNYPILIDKTNKIVGVENIIDYLKKCIKSHNTKILSKTDNERLDDFWKQTIGKIEFDDSGNIKPCDDDSDESNDENLHHRIQEVFEKRNELNSKPASLKKQNNKKEAKSHNKKTIQDDSPVKTLSKMKKKGNANIDDTLMEKFFENMEES